MFIGESRYPHGYYVYKIDGRSIYWFLNQSFARKNKQCWAANASIFETHELAQKAIELYNDGEFGKTLLNVVLGSD